MRKNHRLFFLQIGIAILVFLVLSYLIRFFFYKDPKVESYLTFNKGIKTMATSTSAMLDSLIIKDEVTFDPTSGKEIDKVFQNLKETEKPKFLMIGSSQLRVVQGKNITETYDQLVSQRLQDHSDAAFQIYNLSLGGMTIKEKLIVAQKASELLDPDKVLIAVTPWDCISDNIRPTVKELADKNYTKKENKERKGVLTEDHGFSFPSTINDKVSDYTEEVVEDNVEIYAKRTAIKKWLKDETITVLKEGEHELTESSPKAIGLNIPRYWLTVNQSLDNKTGWDTTVFRSGTRSVKISNDEVKNSKWFGDEITLEKPTATFEFRGWSKTEDVARTTKLLCLDFQVFFEDGSYEWYFKNLKFSKGTHDWEEVATKVTFDKKVVAVKPHMLFYGGTGHVWFDDISIHPIYEGTAAENIAPNPSFEEEATERIHVSYSYKDDEWQQIYLNMASVVDFLSETRNKGASMPILLMTPFWHHKDKTAYPQKDKYEETAKRIKEYCEEKEVLFVDASYILSKDNFGVYTQGSVRDKIDVLHFDAKGHLTLATFIIKELDL
ncbi:hypothetical protein ACFQ1M_13030 [Sungkyunkwania multivorans]|uniref:SGNH/GDSL hydrolase family protein n=1 Tax=Sungkyunkwania multivorans TaxID=1173618 RepID=A0ABW3D1Y0_9FLAO